MSLPPNADYVVNEFHQAVNMSEAEIGQWLQTAESRSAPNHDADTRIQMLLRKQDSQYTDGDIGEMQRVIDAVREQMLLESKPQDVEHSAWRYGLMNWGHDPLKDARH